MNKTVATEKAGKAGKGSKPKASGGPVAAASKAAAAKKAPASAKADAGLKADAAKASPAAVKSQAQRLLEAVQKARAGQSRGDFARSIGKATLARDARKTGKGEVGGSNV